MEKIKAEFTEFTNGSNWVAGKCGPYQFDAKLFDIGSEFGIENGRVSKLSIGDESGLIVNYDRGWDTMPGKEVMPYYMAIMDLLEKSPKRFA